MAVHELKKSQPIDEKEAAIIAAARTTFLSRGFDTASMDAIALSAGVSKRTVYNRFRSKEELFAATILQTCRRVLPLDVDELDISQAPTDLFHQLSLNFLSGILEPEAIALRRIAAFEAARTPALGKSYLEHGPRFMVEVSKPILEKIIERHQFAIDNVEQAIWRLGSLITEPLYTVVLMGQTPTQLERAIEVQIDSGLDAFFKIYPIQG